MVHTATQPLAWHDLQHCLRRAPQPLLAACKKFGSELFVAGGFIRACVANEEVNDIDCFTSSKEKAQEVARYLSRDFEGNVGVVSETDNAFTVSTHRWPIQVIHRWTFAHPSDCIQSFDFTISRSAFWWENHVMPVQDVGDTRPLQIPDLEKTTWYSLADTRFYADLASKRLIYTMPMRNEDAGGSLLRVLKYYQRGYRIPIDHLGAVMARLMMGVRYRAIEENDEARWHAPLEVKLGEEITRLLREVDPDIDPGHIAHLPPEKGASPA